MFNNSEVPVTRYMLVDGSKLEVDLRTGDIKHIKAVVPTETEKKLESIGLGIPNKPGISLNDQPEGDVPPTNRLVAWAPVWAGRLQRIPPLFVGPW